MTLRPLPWWVYLAAGAFGATLVTSGCVFYLSPSCTDRIRNGDETDVDCGGRCGRCDIGSSCRVDTDCDDSNCVTGTCTAFACANGRLDAGETDVDCGGPSCRKCAGGRACEAASDCFNASCGAGTRTCAELASVTFAAAVPYPSGSKTYAVFAGDLDADLDIDVAAANETDNSVSVFINDGAGAFVLRGAPFPTGDYPTGLAFADFDRDGSVDVVTADYHGDSVSILRGTGGGTLGAKTTYPTVADGETSTLAVGDLDGDDFPDVVATNPQRASASVFLNRGAGASGALAPAVDLPVGATAASEPYSTAIGDFNGDARNDLAIADVRSRTIIVRIGNGDGSFQAEVPYAARGAGAYILIARDVNLDGQLDLVCANRGSDNVSVLIGRGDGTFRKAILASTGTATGPYSIAVADFNVDGVPDLVTANFRTGNASVLLGIGDGSFEPPIDAGQTSSVRGRFTYGVAAGDFNADGKPDFAVANPDDATMAVKLSTAQ
jgi:hypothetical protein